MSPKRILAEVKWTYFRIGESERSTSKHLIALFALTVLIQLTIGVPLYAVGQNATTSRSTPALFLPAVLYNSGGGGPVYVAVADLNRDGRPDLVVANICCAISCESGSIAVLLGNGDGTYAPAETGSPV